MTPPSTSPPARRGIPPPPDPSGNGHDGHDGPGLRDPHEAKRAPAPPGAGPFGFALFLVSLGVLFVAGIVGWAVIRSRAAVWPPPGLPPLPVALRVSTALILASGVTVEIAARAARSHRPDRLKVALLATVVLGAAFLVSQTVGFVGLALAGVTMRSSLWGFLGWFFAALHALHVVGGLVPLGIVAVNAFHDRVSPLAARPVRYVATYWHFLGGVWIVLWLLLTQGL